MGHIRTDITVRGNKAAVKLKSVLIGTGATYTVLPEELLKKMGASLLPAKVAVELGNGKKEAKAYGVAIKIRKVEAPSVSITFKGAKTVIGVENTGIPRAQAGSDKRQIGFHQTQRDGLFLCVRSNSE